MNTAETIYASFAEHLSAYRSSGDHLEFARMEGIREVVEILASQDSWWQEPLVAIQLSIQAALRAVQNIN